MLLMKIRVAYPGVPEILDRGCKYLVTKMKIGRKRMGEMKVGEMGVRKAMEAT